MSTKPEIERERGLSIKIPGINNASQNNAQVEQSVIQSSETSLGTSSRINENSMDILGKTQTTTNEKNTNVMKDLSEKYRLIALHTSDLISFTTFDAEPIYTYVSPSHKKILGYEAEDLLGKSALDFIHEDDKQHIMTILLSYIEAKINGVLTSDMMENTPKLDFRLRDKSGQWHFMHSTADIVNDELLLISKDITEQKKAEQMLRESEEKYRNLVERATDGILIMQDSKIIYVNPFLAQLWGGKQEEMSGTLFIEYIDVSERIKIMEYYQKRLVSEPVPFSYETKLRRKNGEIILAEINSGLITLGEKPAHLVIVRDITERKKVEIALQESEDRFRKIFEDSPIPTLLAEIPSGLISYVNKKYLSLFNSQKEQVIGKRAIDIGLLRGPIDQEKLISTLITHGKIDEMEVESFDRDGHPSILLLSMNIVTIQGKLYVLIVIQNITKRKQAEEELQESEKKFKSIFDNANDGFVSVDLKSRRFFNANRKMIEMLGYESEEEIKNLTVSDIHPEKDLPWILKEFEKHARGEISRSECIPVKRKDGSVFFASISSSPLTVVNKTYLSCIFIDITERKRSEDALRRSEEKYRLVTDNASDVIWTMDMDLRFTYVSPSNEKMTGYSPEKMLEITLDKLLTPESVELALQTFATEMQFEKSGERDPSRSVLIELNEIKADGSIIPIEARMCLIYDTHQNPIGILGITREISERKKQEEALKKSEEKFVKAFKSSPVAICITRISDGKFIEVNESLEKLSGYSHAELLTESTIGLNLWVNSEDRKQVVETLAKTGSVHNREYRFRVKSGNEIVVRYSSEVIDFSGELCCLSVLVDITEQKKIEESLRENEEKFRGIVENTKDVIMLTLPDGRVSYLSPACTTVLGFNPDDLIGKIPDVVYPDDAEMFHKMLLNTLQGSSGTNLEYRILTKNGETKWVSHSWSPIYTEDQKMKYIVSVVRDISESKIFEQNLKEKIEELERYKNVTVDREIKMIELKNKINELHKQLKQKTNIQMVED